MKQIHNQTQKILDQISEKHIVPRSRYYFLCRNSILWVPGIITTLIGAYTVAGILYGISHTNWTHWKYTEYSQLFFYIITLPFWWILSYIIFSFITIVMLRKTNTGYRHATSTLLGLSLTGSIISGILFYSFIEHNDTSQLAFYRQSTNDQQERLWFAPEHGRIAGKVHARSATSFTVIDIRGNEWLIKGEQLYPQDLASVQNDMNIRIIGIPESENSIIACHILEWRFPLDARVLSQQTPMSAPQAKAQTFPTDFSCKEFREKLQK